MVPNIKILHPNRGNPPTPKYDTISLTISIKTLARNLSEFNLAPNRDSGATQLAAGHSPCGAVSCGGLSMF